MPDGQRPISVGDGTYTVRRGDTLSGIATRVGVDTPTLASINGIADADSIQPGQTLRLARANAAESTPADTQETASSRVATAETEDAGASAPVAPVSEVAAATQTGSMSRQRDSAAAAHGRSLLARLQDPEPRPAGDDEAPGEAVGAGDPVSAAAEQAPALAADPSDYGVGDDGTIEIQAAETLGHYAEWLDLRASQLRRVNGMRYGTPLVIGHRLKLDFSRVDTDTFEQRRLTYHEQLQARFFEQFRIAGTEKVLVRDGDSLWTLARRADNVPVWLLRQYNPDLDFEALHPGIPVTMPTVERQSSNDEGGDSVELAENQLDP